MKLDGVFVPCMFIREDSRVYEKRGSKSIRHLSMFFIELRLYFFRDSRNKLSY